MTEADNPTRTMSNTNLRSIFLMVAAMGCFTLVDLLIKIASQTLPVGQVMMTLGAGSTAVFVFLIIARGEGAPEKCRDRICRIHPERQAALRHDHRSEDGDPRRGDALIRHDAGII